MASFQPRTRDSSARELVYRVMSPRIAVIASQDATELCHANHLPSIVDLFKPFGELIEGRVTVVGSTGLPSSMDDFSLRFTEIDQLEELDPKMTQRWLAEVVRDAAEGFDDPFNIRGREQVTHDYLNASPERVFPWYTRYRDLFFNTGGVSDHETFDHPVACIVAISSLAQDPLNEIHQLNNLSTPPLVFERVFMDPSILKYYVLLHDCSKGNLNSAMETLEKMRRTGLHCNILKINSVDPNNTTLPKDRNAKYWTKSVALSKLVAMGHAAKDGSTNRSSLSSITSTSASGTLVDLASQRSSTSSPVSSGTGNNSPTFPQSSVYAQLGNDDEDGTFDQEPLSLPPTEDQGLTMDLLLHPEKLAEPYGCCLSDDDISGISQLLKEMLSQSIIPYMERNIAHWNEQVAVSRKGIAGRFRRYFGTGSKNPALQQSPTAGPNGSVIYPHGSPEAQMRKLADWAFMLRDYKFALSVYETVKKDFSADKAWKYYGGAQEMIGLCLLMAPQQLGSKNDVDHYFESAVNSYIHKARSPYFGSRATLLCYEHFRQRNMYRESPITLTRMTAEASDLRNGLFLEQAAHCYLRLPRPQVRKYAFHMIMAGHRFNRADQKEHAYRCYAAAALVYDSKGWALVDDHISCSLGRQSYQLGKSEEVLDHYKKLLRESRQDPQQQAVYMKEFLSVYRDYTNKIEADPLRETFPEFPLPVVLGSTARIVLSTSQSVNENNDAWTELEGALNNSSNASGGRTVSAVGEHVLVTVNIKNPLQTPLILTDVVLGCEHSTSTTSFTVPVDAAEEAHLALYDQQSPTFEGKVSFNAFDCGRIDRVILEPGQVRTLTFEILPKLEGQIRVMGLHCNVEGQVHAYKDIIKRGKRLNTTKEQMMSQMYEEDKSLIILVAPEMPLLDVEFHSAPEMLLSGEVCELSLEIKNRGKKGLKNLMVRMSHPTFFCIGEKKDEGALGLYNMGEGNAAVESIQVDNSLQLNTTRKILDTVLAPGESIKIPSWLRGEKIGKHSFLFVFSYDSEQEGTAMGVRTLRHTVTAQVLPSLKINAFTRPSTKGLNEFILGIETENLQTVPIFEFLQMTSLSASWVIEAVDKSADSEEYRSITPRQTVFTYYKIRKSGQVVTPTVTPERFMAKALEKLVIGQEQLKDVPPPLDLQLRHLATTESHINSSSPVLQYFSRASRLGWRQASLKAQFSSIPVAVDRRHLFSVYGSNDIDLALFWNIPKMNRRGHHYIIGINLGVQQNPFQPIDPADELDGDGEETETARRALYEQTMRDQAALVQALTMNPHFRDESPVKISMRSEDSVQHDFNRKRLCSTPVKIVIKNCSWNKHIAYTLEMLSSKDPMVPQKPPGILDNTQQSLSQGGAAAIPGSASAAAAMIDLTDPHVNAHPFFWSGPTFSTGYLEPLAEIEIVFMACFTQHGVYDINRWRLAVQVVKAQRKKKTTAKVQQQQLKQATKEVKDREEEEEERQAMMAPVTPQGVGKGFMQMPNLAHYIQVS